MTRNAQHGDERVVWPRARWGRVLRCWAPRVPGGRWWGGAGFEAHGTKATQWKILLITKSHFRGLSSHPYLDKRNSLSRMNSVMEQMQLNTGLPFSFLMGPCEIKCISIPVFEAALQTAKTSVCGHTFTNRIYQHQILISNAGRKMASSLYLANQCYEIVM